MRARIALPRLSGTIIRGQEVLIARPLGFVFGCRARGRGGLGLRLTPLSIGSTSEELHVVGHDLADAALFAFLILKAAVLQPALDVERVALLDIDGGGFGEPIPADDGMELRLFLAFDRSVGGQAEAGDGLPFWV